MTEDEVLDIDFDLDDSDMEDEDEKREGRTSMSAFFRTRSGSSRGFDSLYKTIVTPENFDSVRYISDDSSEEKTPVEYFDKCVFLSCDMSSMGDDLKAVLFNNCLFVDCDFSYSNPYRTAFSGCNFENNDFHASRFSFTQFEGCMFQGDDFSASVWRSRYFNKPEDGRSDVVDSKFRECDFRGADLGTCIDDVEFTNCNGPVKTLQYLDIRVGGNSYGYEWRSGKADIVRELTTQAVYHGVDLDAKRKVDGYQRLGAMPDPSLVDMNMVKMQRMLNEMCWDEKDRRNRIQWKNLEGLESWIGSTDTRFPRTVRELYQNRRYLQEFASRPENRGKFDISFDKDGRVQSVTRKEDVTLVIDEGLVGGRSRGSRSIA